MKKGRVPNADENQTATQYSGEDTVRMVPSDPPVVSGELTPEEKLARAKYEEARRKELRKALKLAEAIIASWENFDIEFIPWISLTRFSRGAWEDLLATFLPDVSREERKSIREALEKEDSGAYRIMRAEADAAFFLGVAIGRRDSGESTKRKK